MKENCFFFRLRFFNAWLIRDVFVWKWLIYQFYLFTFLHCSCEEKKKKLCQWISWMFNDFDAIWNANFFIPCQSLFVVLVYQSYWKCKIKSHFHLREKTKNFSNYNCNWILRKLHCVLLWSFSSEKRLFCRFVNRKK